MFGEQLGLVEVFCISAVAMFLVSLSVMMLFVLLRRPKTTTPAGQGQPSEAVYSPTTVQAANPELIKPLLNGDHSKTNIYPGRELELLKGGGEHA